MRTSPDAGLWRATAAAAIAVARQGQIASLILPADTAWNRADGIAEVEPAEAGASYAPRAVEEAARRAARRRAGPCC
ncbi:MAG: hypothetical protein MZV49_17070 [Rhodopseudomonas palustris]|nr:hypothetical protein [Rhodopseudomonas palustris]